MIIENRASAVQKSCRKTFAGMLLICMAVMGNLAKADEANPSC